MPRGAFPAAGGSWELLAGRALGHGDFAQIADHGCPSGRRGWRGLRALRPRDPGRAAEAGDAEGDARARPAAQGGGGQDQRVSAGHSAGGSGHARERGLEEELDGRRRRQVSVSLAFRHGRGDLAPAQASEAAFLLRAPSGESRSRMPPLGLPEALGAAAG